MSAFQQHLRSEYPNTPIEEALRQQLPATEADATASGLRTAGVDVSKPAGQMTPAEIEQITKECSGASGSNSGEVFDRGEESPEWVESLWSPASEAGSDSDSGSSVTSDNS